MDVDVIIIGGGVTGLTCALSLAKLSLKVCVLDSHIFRPLFSCTDYDVRVSAITPVSAQVFTALHAWPLMQQLRISPFQHITVWDETGVQQINFHAREAGEKVLGYIIENAVLQTGLFQQLSQASITYMAPAKVTGITVHAQKVQVTLADGQELSGRLLIGADGAHSQVREFMGTEVETHDYAERALVATIQTTLPHQQTARQRFLATGPLAFLPLADQHYCSIVWSLPSAQAQALAAMPEAEFDRQLQQAFGDVLGSVKVISQRLTFPLQQRHVKQYVQPRIALIGDAAHTLHPLAGQGVNLGILDAMSLAEVISEAQQQRRDIGLLYTLRRYERWRKSTNTTMLRTVDMLHYLFQSLPPSLTLARELGLAATERCQPLKNWFMRQAMGFSSSSGIGSTLIQNGRLG